MHMAGVETDAQPVPFMYTVIDHFQFLKGSPQLAALSCHRLQRNINIVLVLVQHKVETLYDLRDPGLLPGSHMGARMQNQDPAAHGGCPLYLLFQKSHAQLKSFRFHDISQIDNVRRMNHDLLNARPFGVLPSRLYIQRRNLFSHRILRRPRVKHQDVCPVGLGLLYRSQKHFLPGHFHMGTYFDFLHFALPSSIQNSYRLQNKRFFPHLLLSIMVKL